MRDPPELWTPFCHGPGSLACPHKSSPVPQTPSLRVWELKQPPGSEGLRKGSCCKRSGCKTPPSPGACARLQEPLGDFCRAPTWVTAKPRSTSGQGPLTGAEAKLQLTPAHPASEQLHRDVSLQERTAESWELMPSRLRCQEWLSGEAKGIPAPSQTHRGRKLTPFLRTAPAHAVSEEACVSLLLHAVSQREPFGSYLEDAEQSHRFLEDIRPNKIFQLGQGFLQVIYCTYPKAGSKSLEEAAKTH